MGLAARSRLESNPGNAGTAVQGVEVAVRARGVRCPPVLAHSCKPLTAYGREGRGLEDGRVSIDAQNTERPGGNEDDTRGEIGLRES